MDSREAYGAFGALQGIGGQAREITEDQVVVLRRAGTGIPENRSTAGDFHLKINLFFDLPMRAGEVNHSRTY